MYLFDTCLLSELKKPDCDKNVLAFSNSIERTDFFISTISIGEISKGIHLLDNGARKKDLAAWLSKIRVGHEKRILPVSQQISYRWGELMALMQKRGRSMPIPDGLIAATALHYDLRIATRNTKDFVETGVSLVNPWES